MLPAYARQRPFQGKGLLVWLPGEYFEDDQIHVHRDHRVLFAGQPGDVEPGTPATTPDFRHGRTDGVEWGCGRYPNQHSRALQLCGQRPKLLGQGAERLAVEARSGGRLGRRDKSRRADEQGDTPEERQASVY